MEGRLLPTSGSQLPSCGAFLNSAKRHRAETEILANRYGTNRLNTTEVHRKNLRNWKVDRKFH